MKIYKRQVRVCQEEWSGNGFNNAPNIVSEWLPEDEGEKMCHRLEDDRISNDAAADRFYRNKSNLPDIVKEYHNTNGAFRTIMPYFLQERFVEIGNLNLCD